MAEGDLTLGEIGRSLIRIEAEQRALAARITESAREMVPAKLWAAELLALQQALAEHIRQSDQTRERLERELAETRKAHVRELAAAREEIKEDVDDVRGQVKDVRDAQSKRSEFTWQRVLGLLALAATVAGVVVAALALSKGVH
jgi:ribosomal protein L16 Arg81 hydroxylase